MVDKKLNIWIRLKGGKQAETQMKSLGDSVKTVVSLFATSAIIKGSVDLMKLAGQAEGVDNAFQRISGSIEILRKASRGVVSDLKLKQLAVQAYDFGISADAMARGLEFASKVAVRTGKDVDYLVDSFVSGVARKSLPILDNLGIKMQEVSKEMKKTGGDFQEAVGNIINRRLEKMGDVAKTSAEDIAGLAVQFDELKVEVGKFLNESGIAWFGTFLINGIRGLRGLIQAFKDIGKPIEEQVKNLEKMGLVAKETSKGMKKAYKDPIKDMVTDWEEFFKTLDDKQKDEVKAWLEDLDTKAELQGKWFEMMVEKEMEFQNKKKEVAKQILEIMRESRDRDIIKVAEEYNKRFEIIKDFTNKFTSLWSQALLNQWNEGQNFFDNMVRGFKQMLAAMVAELFAKSAIFTIFGALGLPGLNTFTNAIIPGGSIFSIGGGANLVAGGGGNTTNVNLIVQGNLIGQKDYVRKQIIPELQDAARKGYV